jgi:V8-like Glu-specific endopeptidase
MGSIDPVDMPNDGSANICQLFWKFPNDAPNVTSEGTGFLIAPNIVLTTSHNLNDPNPNFGGGPASNMVVQFPTLPAIRALKWTATATWVKADCFSPERGLSAYDFGIIVLPQAIDATVNPLRYTASSSPGDIPLITVAGYPEGTSQLQGAQVQPVVPDRGQDILDSRIFYPVNTIPGMSGGPVYINSGTGVVAIGIHTSFNNDYPDGVPDGLGSGLLLTPSVVAVIQQWVNENGV